MSPDSTSRLPPPARRLRHGRTQVVLQWKGDRWAHRVTVDPPGDGPTWESVEDDLDEGGDPRWPASPPLVELAMVQVGEKTVLTGIGQAGRSHYSVSFAPAAEPDRIHVEVACRLQETPGWLGTTYRADGPNPILWRLPAHDPGGPLPRTVTWAYLLGPDGPEVAPTGRDAGCDRG
jgi:hypothetical protein